ncbi:helix-turn-helix domain-containing protein [Nocardioides psychrotolerans]|uniref:HTH cro/C1-type domain-containing protein n=1 Tax=Nocardioides psychrotolerans TaxID=1005945 RepID=A0A1I3GJQ1_9ACTN|nr:transcriptional regulator [Nocardioides psychrotolerans]SFI23728.1 hypothetical protein SAMN05216561_106166 [Nocardioides psychrotolerans]
MTSTSRSDEPVTAEPTFVRGNKRLDEMLAKPGVAERVALIQAESRELDRVYAENLAVIRKAGDQTQAEVAVRMGVDQGAVSRLERRDDMLLSTLADYLHATGAEHPRLVATINGVEVELDLDRLRRRA